jgi:hypothetical protein
MLRRDRQHEHRAGAPSVTARDLLAAARAPPERSAHARRSSHRGPRPAETVTGVAYTSARSCAPPSVCACRRAGGPAPRHLPPDMSGRQRRSDPPLTQLAETETRTSAWARSAPESRQRRRAAAAGPVRRPSVMGRRCAGSGRPGRDLTRVRPTRGGCAGFGDARAGGHFGATRASLSSAVSRRRPGPNRDVHRLSEVHCRHRGSH